MKRLLLALSFTLVPSVAFAQKEDVTTLEKQLTTELSTLSTSDCTTACKALKSIRHAADRICVLEPGPRCDAARKKADDATKRVRDACPDCSLGLEGKPEQAVEDNAKKPAEPAQAPPSPASESAPKGGCRNCSSTNADPGDFGVFVLALLLLQRRRKKDSRASHTF